MQQNWKNICTVGRKYHSAVLFVALRSRHCTVCEVKQISWNVQLCLFFLLQGCTYQYQYKYVIVSVNAHCEAVIILNGNYSLLCLGLTAETEKYMKYISLYFDFFLIQCRDVR